jgi:signal transduction histidine kinase
MSEIGMQQLGMNFWLTMTAIALQEGIAVYVWRFRRERGALPLIGIQVGKAIWLLGVLITAITSNGTLGIYWFDVASLATVGISYACFRFLAELREAEAKIHLRIDRISLALLAAYAVTLLTNRWHHLYWHPGTQGITHQLEGGPLFRFWIAVNLGLNFLYLVLLTVWAVRERGLRRQQAQTLLVSALVSWTAWYLAQIPAIREKGALPIGFALSSLIMTWAFLRWRLLGMMPLAQEAVFNSRVDALMILDSSDRIIALNSAARALFPRLRLTDGDALSKAIADWPALAALAEDRHTSQLDAGREISGRPLVFEVAQTALRNDMGQSLGRVFSFADVTEERRELSRKMEQQKATTMIEERHRLGRELHDSGQVWYFLSSQSQLLQHLLQRNETERALEIVNRMIALLHENSFNMRESMLGLQSELDAQQDLPRAIEEQLDWYRRHCEMDAQLRMESPWKPERVSPDAQAQLLRIAQEALANTRKHAAAQIVRVAVDLGSDRLTLSIADNGRGFDAEQSGKLEGHFGLKNMRERAESIGARLQLEAAPGAGSRITVELPLV